MRLRLTISYDGAPFSGWQSQPNGNGVQDFVERAFLRILQEGVVLHGAGRTDAGVHALGQCAHADVPEGRVRLTDWRRALNANLPREIRILDVHETDALFHARLSATGKIYRYRLWNGEVMSPLECNRVWHIPGPLNFELLRSAAMLFQGRHDFAAFSANRGKRYKNKRTSERTIQCVRVTRHSARDIWLTFEGEGFLYKMVRMLTSASVRVAQGKEAADWIPRLLSSPLALKKSQHVAPAQGLYLVRVVYGKGQVARPGHSKP